jgi:hypothetical protein
LAEKPEIDGSGGNWWKSELNEKTDVYSVNSERVEDEEQKE